MNRIRIFSVYLVCCIITFIAATSCSKKRLSEPDIDYGIARIEGKIKGKLPEKLKGKNVSLTLIYTNIITEFQWEYETSLSEDGTFVFEIPVASAGLGFISSEIYEGLVGLVPRETTRMEIFYDETEKQQVNMTSSINFTTEDMLSLREVTMAVFIRQQKKNIDSIFYPSEQPDRYIQYKLNSIREVSESLMTDTLLSENAKRVASNSLKLFYLNNDLLNNDLTELFIQYNQQMGAEKNLSIQSEQSLYAFLKYFDLNNPQYLYCDYYYLVLQSLLDNQILNIPRIGETPVSDWMKEVKAIFSTLTGFDTGLFYDMLAASAYSKQFIDETRPLSEQQEKNIKTYFKNKSFTKILLTENEKIARVAGITSHLKVNETPAVPLDSLMDAIVSPYKGKVVVVDFWATWCGPCLHAMQTSRELKQDMLNKAVVFVYIADTSSPKKLWEKKIPGIGGEHYYLTGEEWESISYSDKYGFEGIPTYLVFDKNGELKHKITLYPGNDEMRSIIEKLLP